MVADDPRERGRPVYLHGREEWVSRLVNRTLCAAAVGAVGGLAIGIVRKQSPLLWSRSAGVNCAIATCLFTCSQEMVCQMRAADPDDWLNTFFGGFASGALIGRLHGGRARALPMALLFATVGSGIHLGAIQLGEYRLRHFLASLPGQEEVGDVRTHKVVTKQWNFPKWFPIQRLDEEALKKRALEEEMIQKILREKHHSEKVHVEDS